MDKVRLTTRSAVKSQAEVRMRQALQLRQRTLLAAGPMSQNCVDAILELSRETTGPITLIASRRQVDSAEMGGGYVNNWTTEKFAQYVHQHKPRGQVLLARDHGGPWQNPAEVAANLSLAAAMASAKKSFAVDIQSGFDVIHLDPSIDIHHDEVDQDELIDRLFELFEFCESIARRAGRQLVYEIGTEEQTGTQQDLNELSEFLAKVIKRCAARGVPLPLFVVVQTGTKVKETRNVGTLSEPHRLRGIIPPEVHITQLVETCERYGVWLKEHNTDYLSDDVLSWHPRAGIHAANVAPEFGVAETRHLLRLFGEFNLESERDAFLQLSLASRKWEKWLMPQSTASDIDKAIIAGHYVFSDPEFLEIRQQLDRVCRSKGFDLNASIRASLKHSIRRYLYAFNLLDR